MRTIFTKLAFLPCLFALVSCQGRNISSINTASKLSHDYKEIEDKIIEWKDIFSICYPRYFVYIYSETCSHCNAIKNEVIEFSINSPDTFFFVRFNKEEIALTSDVKKTIGAKSVCDLSILGTPTLIEIVEGAVANNIAGSTQALEFLNSVTNGEIVTTFINDFAFNDVSSIEDDFVVK